MAHLTRPSPEALQRLNRFVIQSSRDTHLAISPELLRSTNPDRPAPASTMVRGGRGQGLRLRLYLTLLMRATSSPYVVRDLHPGLWAEAMNLPADTGPRRVNEALDWFAAQRLITVERSARHTPVATLLSARGDGASYLRPHEELGRLKYYVQLPLGLWRHGWIVALPAAHLGVLLALLDNSSGKDTMRFVPTERRNEYGLSPDSWTQAIKNLSDLGVVTKSRIKIGDDYRWDRLRNAYTLHRTVLEHPLPVG